MPPTKKAREATDKASISFNRSDEEVELLLEVVLHYKSDTAGQGLDWESIKTKHLDICDVFVDRSPKTLRDESYPHHDAAKHFTKERIISKLKELRNKYKTALDSGRRSGGGKVVAQFCNLCTDTGEDVQQQNQLQVELILVHQQNHQSFQAIQVLLLCQRLVQMKIKKRPWP